MKFSGKVALFALLTIAVQSLCSLNAMDDSPDRTGNPLLKNEYGTMGTTSPRGILKFPAADETTPLTGEAITREASRILTDNQRLFTTSSMAQAGRRVHYTTLGGILNAHDEIGRLVQSANNQGGLRNTALIPSDTFTALQKLEKALRKMIHLTWGALMLEGEDLVRFRAEKSAPYLYGKRGFEGTYKAWYGAIKETQTRPATVYSFPDDGNTHIYVAQIRQIADAVDIDLDAQINLHFHPIEKEFRKKMAEAYIEEFPGTPMEQAYVCMLKILAERKSGASSLHATPERGSVNAADSSSDTPQQRLLGDIIPVRNELKFKLLMNEGTAASLDGGQTRQLIIDIANRLSGSGRPATVSASLLGAGDDSDGGEGKEADELIAPRRDPFMHRDFLRIPYGSPLKPTTTAGYMASQA
ncbi:MAG: hypothetical protein K2Q34_08865, partial [Alphaproteobacteria bacterium]|nr:hypothetical protein [Alphaproteobacteria bacterium]